MMSISPHRFIKIKNSIDKLNRRLVTAEERNMNLRTLLKMKLKGIKS